MNKLQFATAMRARTKQFAIQIIRFYGKLPKTEEAKVLGRQLLRAGTAMAANYRAVCRSKSSADSISKLGAAVEEADETQLWLELLEGAGVVPIGKTADLSTEAGELVRILQTSLNSAKRNRDETADA